jgi:hypothetical protein
MLTLPVTGSDPLVTWTLPEIFVVPCATVGTGFFVVLTTLTGSGVVLACSSRF